jgi:sensor c-di-GMP phosphodiesterase-like protein
MKCTLKQRVLVTTAVALAGALCGVTVALLIATTLALETADLRLQSDAEQLITAHTAFQDEAHTLLAAMNASQYAFCSDDEIAYFRKLIFHAEYYRDAGHIRDGRIVCSATLGRDNLPQMRHFPAVSLADGMTLLSRFSPYDSGEQRVSARVMGDSFVNLDPGVSRRLDLITTNRSLTVIDAITKKPTHPGRPFSAPEAVKVDRNWQGRVGNTLYATRCDSRNLNCMTTYAAIPQVLSSWGGVFIGSASLGGLAGMLIGLALAYLKLRDRSLEHQLRNAILKDQLRVVYQPIVEAATRRIVGAEALARWTDEGGIPISPDVFVKIAEECGFVGSITRLVLRHSLRDFAGLLAKHPDFRLSVNVAAADLSDPEFLPMLEQSLLGQSQGRESVPADCLTIEIRESSTASHEVAIRTIGELRKRGHAIHIDDFGTGYSSLSYLRDLSVDAIKIDKSFTQAIGTEAVTVGILRQILAMAEALNLNVVVEGVETELQADYFAAAEQTVFAQGWLFGRPVPAEEFQRLLAKQEKDDSASADAA